MEPKITIIIPVYNVYPYLARCLDSVVSQSYKNLEIIVIDDGSTDGSENMVDDYGEKDSRIKAIHQKNSGLSSARNVGLDNASGDYILFVDSDDWIEQDAVRIITKCLRDNDGMDIIEFGYSTTNGERIISKVQFKNTIIKDSKNILDEFFFGDSITDIVCNKLYNKRIFQDLRFDVGKIHEDYRIMPKILEKASSLCILNDSIYFYYERQNSITKTVFSKKNLERIDACEQVIEYCRSNSGILHNYILAAQIRLCFVCIYLFDKFKKDKGDIIYKKLILHKFNNTYCAIRNTEDFYRLPIFKRTFLRMFRVNKSFTLIIFNFIKGRKS